MEIPSMVFDKICSKHIDILQAKGTFDMPFSGSQVQDEEMKKHLRYNFDYSMAKKIVESDNVECSSVCNAGPMHDKWDLYGKVYIIKRGHLKQFAIDIMGG